MRLVQRIKGKVSLSDEKAQALESAIADVFKRRFIRAPNKPEEKAQTQRNEELLNVVKEYLDKKVVETFKDALQSGYWPMPKER